MRILIRITILIGWIGLIKCADKSVKQTNIDIKGHWHLVKPDSGNFETLDIDDSVSHWDKYDLSHSAFDVCLRFDRITGNQILPTQDDGWTTRFHLDGDTLYIGFDSLHLGKYVRPENSWDSSFYCKYVRSDLMKCKIADRFGYYFNPVPQLPQTETSIPFDTLTAHYPLVNLLVGFFGKQDSLVKIVHGDVYVSEEQFDLLWKTRSGFMEWQNSCCCDICG